MEVTNNRANGNFFRFFPPEIRNMVYRYVFSGVSIYFITERKCFYCRPNVISSPPNALALIRACRQTRWEIGNMWLRSVLFNFQSSALMFKTLRHLPNHIISEIRHICVDDYRIDRNPPVYQFLESALSLLQGLQLDRLTVLGTRCPYHSYNWLKDLLKNTSGWKELNFATRIADLSAWIHDLGIEGDIGSYWQRELDDRDGETTTPLVKAYQLVNAQVPVSPSHIEFEKVSDSRTLQSL
ncbi:hypothetical protein EV127DRAFT_101825 [Xylaria flabelliformis]|nr:hypothetical protein EV127DRAFT_101825 [Xylaria flabelliformis]